MQRNLLSKLLEPFSQDSRETEICSSVPKNTTLKALRLLGCVGSDNVDELTWMLKTNNSLSTLSIKRAALGPQDWKDIFQALNENKTLRELDLSFCKGLSGQDVGDALMDLLQSNNIRLTQIILEATGIYALQGRVNKELRRNVQYRAKLQRETAVHSKSGRLILCGFGYAGKTSICKTMEAIDYGIPWSPYSFNTFWKKAMQTFPGVQRLLSAKNAYNYVTGRTRGFDVVGLKQQGYLKFIWDFAGQKAYYALHDYLFPDTKNSCFLYVCSCRCPPTPQNPKGAINSQESMKGECAYWMKFIASNSEPHRKQLPHVRFVLTNRDTLTSGELKISTQWAQHVVRDLKVVFKDVLQLSETVEVVNSHSFKDVKDLLTLTDKSLKEILEHETEYALCEEVRHALAKRPANNPVMTCNDFYTIRDGIFKFEDSPKDVREAILAYLNDLGKVIFPEGFEFVVTNPRWFGVGVLGAVIDAFKGVEGSVQTVCTNLWSRPTESFGLVHEKGIVDRKDVKNLLKDSLQTTHLEQTISFENLIDLMIYLELCFESHPGNMDSPLFLPALFDDEKEAAAKGERQLKWRLEQKEPLHYIGRRLECQNKSTTFLTPGFFPRLQVHFRNYFHQQKWTENRGFYVDRNLICFAHNGVEVLVEYSGYIDYFVDVLVRSSKSPAEVLEFLHEHVVRKIQDFCALQNGCQGVLLVEAVIRKVCVEELHLCKDRKDHSVLISTLEGELENDIQYRHTWSHPVGDEEDTDFALELLERGHLQKTFVRSSKISTSTASSSGHSEDSPKLFYASIENVGMLDRLNIKLNLARKMPVKLHLMCDHKDGHHIVDDQPGRTIQFSRTGGAHDVPILKLAVTLLWAGVGVASNISGASAVVPSVDRWIESLLDVPEMPDINGETLHEMMNLGKTSKRVSEQDIRKALERYWKIDCQSQGLKQILNLQDTAEFLKSFGLRKVVYTCAPHENKIGWVCDCHYWPGLRKGILHSV